MTDDAISLPRSYREAIQLDRALRHADGMPALTVALAGTANLEFLAPGFRVGLAAEGFRAVTRSAAFGNWISEALSGTAEPCDVWIVWLSTMGLTRGMSARTNVDITAIAAATERLIAGGSTVVVVHPEPLSVEDDPFSAFATWRRDVVDSLRAALHPSVVQMSVDHVVRRLGTDRWTATRYWEQAKAPCHPDAASAIGLELSSVVARLMRPAIRAVAVDLDDTLWGGLVGEVGPDGLELDPDGTGRPYLALQRFLLDLSERGIPIGVVSKNDDTEARRPFLERSEMVLGLDSFVRFDASWGPKYKAIAAFARQLNIGIDAVCFLDDSPKERDEARRMLAGLVVPELPEAPSERVDYLVRSRKFFQPRTSDEDRRRVEFFKQSAPLPEHNLDTYLAGLGMELDALRIDATTLERVSALLHKTNQFNVTLWRPSPAELASFVAEPSNYAFAFRLRDRVLDAGVIAVLLARVEIQVVSIEAWVLSCRVFDRGVEWAIADHLARWLDHRGLAGVVTQMVEGPRNAMVRDVLINVGLAAAGSDHGATQFIGNLRRLPVHHITIKEP